MGDTDLNCKISVLSRAPLFLKPAKNEGRLFFPAHQSYTLAHLSPICAALSGESDVKKFRYLGQDLVIVFAQLTSRAGLCHIEACLLNIPNSSKFGSSHDFPMHPGRGPTHNEAGASTPTSLRH